MKIWLFMLNGFLATSAFAADFETVAFERLNYELVVATNASAKLEIAVAYFDDLERVGAKPRSAAGCIKSVLGNVLNEACLPITPQARSGGGTGGVD